MAKKKTRRGVRLEGKTTSIGGLEQMDTGGKVEHLRDKTTYVSDEGVDWEREILPGFDYSDYNEELKGGKEKSRKKTTKRSSTKKTSSKSFTQFKKARILYGSVGHYNYEVTHGITAQELQRVFNLKGVELQSLSNNGDLFAGYEIRYRAS